MRRENGVLHFKEGWFLKYVYSTNSFLALMRWLTRGSHDEGTPLPGYPKNLCSLF